MMKQNLSVHRHISFTAHYTGYIWYQMGISHPAFATLKGKLLTQLLRPLESWTEHRFGGSIRMTLKQRHTMLDHAVEQLLTQHSNLQIIEIATGLSPRGWTFRQKHPTLRFLEADLPDMAHSKKMALARAGQPNAKVLAIDLFSTELPDLFAQLSPDAPVLIISEGLVNYFSQEMLKTLWSNLADLGKNFPQFYYYTDLCPEPIHHPFAKLVWKSSQFLKVLSRSAFSFHFTEPQQVIDFFKDCKYRKVDIQQPSQATSDPHAAHLGDFVWLVKAQLA